MIKAGGWCSQHHPRPPFRGRVRPLISCAYPARHQVPRLVHASHPRLVPASFMPSLADHKSSRSTKLDRGAELTRVSKKSATDRYRLLPEHMTR